ncbi:MAG: amidohydrolase [Zoogloeaceae bacterium]|jgi:mannonate dehydratase|nr:amidohydrolase [Zoogloeaceae bacterium]
MTHSAFSRNRRRFLFGALGLAGLAGMGYALGKPHFLNTCRPAVLPPELAQSPWLAQVWDDLDPADVWDTHVHLAGIGDSESGITLGDALNSPLRHPWQYLQRLFYMNGSGAGATRDAHGVSVDEAFLLRLTELMDAFPVGVKSMVLAFDHFHDDAGKPRPERSSFHIPDAYARALAQTRPDRFVWAASIHPYRADAIDRLQQAAVQGAQAIKWLPAAQNMDPASPRCAAFFAELARLDLPLLIHCGKEAAVEGSDTQALGNPLRTRRALEAGVRVLIAHCASQGEDEDFDHPGQHRASFALFGRLMDDPAWQGRLFGDISALTLINHSTATLKTLLERADWHDRLINGSDYPLPGIIPIISTGRLVRAGLLPAEATDDLVALRQHNPLFFDLALKRALRWQNQGFSSQVFATRSFFAREKHHVRTEPA